MNLKSKLGMLSLLAMAAASGESSIPDLPKDNWIPGHHRGSGNSKSANFSDKQRAKNRKKNKMAKKARRAVR
jgi:hypothetical protein